VAADLVEEELQRVGGRGGERDVVERRGLGLAPAVVAQVDPARLDLLVEPADVVVVELERLRQLVDLGQRQAAGHLAPVDERGHGSLESSVDHAHLPCSSPPRELPKPMPPRGLSDLTRGDHF
jgi:hypothetical protein